MDSTTKDSNTENTEEAQSARRNKKGKLCFLKKSLIGVGVTVSSVLSVPPLCPL